MQEKSAPTNANGASFFALAHRINPNGRVSKINRTGVKNSARKKRAHSKIIRFASGEKVGFLLYNCFTIKNPFVFYFILLSYSTPEARLYFVKTRCQRKCSFGKNGILSSQKAKKPWHVSHFGTRNIAPPWRSISHLIIFEQLLTYNFAQFCIFRRNFAAFALCLIFPP